MVSKILIICPVCNKEFEKYPSQVKNGRGQFCGMECFAKHKLKGSSLFCAMCDTEFYRSFHEQSDGDQFCNRNCYDDWRRENSSGNTYLKRDGVHIHRIVAAATMNRDLFKGEVIHHIDANKKNNSPANLVAFPNQNMHAKCHKGYVSNEELDKYRVVNIGGIREL